GISRYHIGGHREYRKYLLTSNGQHSAPFIRSIPPLECKGVERTKEKKKESNPGTCWECIESETEIVPQLSTDAIITDGWMEGGREYDFFTFPSFPGSLKMQLALREKKPPLSCMVVPG